MFSFLSLLWFLTSQFLSYWQIWNFFDLSNSSINNTDVYVNVIQKNKDKYIIEDFANDLWKKQKDISSLWIIANCSWDYTKTDIKNKILNNSWTILSWFNNWDDKVEINNCDFYNIKNPWYNKDLDDTVLNDFSNSKLDDNWNFSWTDIKDITTRWFILKDNRITVSIKNLKKILIVSSEYYLYWSKKNKIKLVYEVWNINFDDITNKTDYFYYLANFYKYIWLNNDWTFDDIKTKPIIYYNKENIFNETSLVDNIWLKVKYNNENNFKEPINYSIITNYEWKYKWKYYINQNNFKTNDKNQKNDFDDKIYLITNKNINTEQKEKIDIADLNYKGLTAYIKNNWDVDNVWIYNDIVNDKNYMAISKNNKYYFFEITWDNWEYEIYNCINKNDDIKNIINSNIQLTFWVSNWTRINNIEYNEIEINWNCFKKQLVDTINTKQIIIDNNQEENNKEPNNNLFYTDKNNYNNYITFNKDYLSKNYIFITPWHYSNILLNLNKHLNKKPYVFYLYKSNNSIKNIEYDPQKQISNFNLDWDSNYDNNYTDDNPKYYNIISNIENTNNNLLQFKIKKDDNIKYTISYDWFIDNIYDDNWLLTIKYDKTNINNFATITITFKNNSWNILNIYKVNIEKKQVVKNSVTLNPWSIWFLYNDWKLYKTLETKQKQNVFIINNLKSNNFICKELTTQITFTAPNILDNFYIYNNKIVNNKGIVNEKDIKSWIERINNDTLKYENIIKNVNLKDYTDNINRFYIESNKITKNNNLQINLNINCKKYNWSNIKLINNQNYNLTVLKDDNRRLSVLFYNPVIENNTLLPLLSYARWKNWKAIIYKNNNIKNLYTYKNLENRLQLTYYWKGIKKWDWNIPIKWSENNFWAYDWNSNKTINDLYTQWSSYWKYNNKYQYTNNNTTTTRGIIYTNRYNLLNQPVKLTKSVYLTPPVCSYTTCWKLHCYTHHRYWEKKRLYFDNRNYNNNYYYDLLWWSLKTQNVDLSNNISNNNIWKSYSYNKVFNFSALINVPVREVKREWKKPLITPFFYIREPLNWDNVKIEYKNSNEIAERMEYTWFDNYINDYLQKARIILNSKLQWYVKKVWYRQTLIGPCLNNYNNWDYNNWNTKRCYVFTNPSDWNFELTNEEYKPYNINQDYNKDIFPINDWKTIENITNLKWVYNFQYIIDVFINFKDVPCNNWNCNISILNWSANQLIDNWWENLFSLDMPIQYIWQNTILWNFFKWELNNKKINNLLSFYNNISNNNFTKIVYWANVFKEYFTKILNGYQNSTVITKKYYWGYHCSHTYYENYIEDKNWNTNQIRTVKMNLWAWYYENWYSDWKYPFYFNDFNYTNDYNSVRKMIDKNLDIWVTKYNNQVWMLWNKIKLFWIWYTNNIWKYTTDNTFWWKIINTYWNNEKSFITNTFEHWNNRYKKPNIINYMKQWKYFNKIIYINDNDNLNKLLFEWEDYNWNKLATWNWITKIIVDYPDVNIIWYNWNNNLKWNITLISKNWDINIMTNINKNENINLYYWIFLAANNNINVWNNVVYINWIYLITNNINTNYSSNPLFINWYVYNLWNWKFVCNRNITNLFLLNTSRQYYTDYDDITFNNIQDKDFTSFFKLYTANKTAGCSIKENYKMRTKLLFQFIWDLWF